MEITINVGNATTFIGTLILCLIAFGFSALLLCVAAQPRKDGVVYEDDNRLGVALGSLMSFLIGIFAVWIMAVWCYQTYGWMG